MIPVPVSEASLRRLREGVQLEDGMTSPARVRQTEPGVLELRLGEGKKRQVRRMLEEVEHRVSSSSASRSARCDSTEPGRRGARWPRASTGCWSPAEVERLRKAATSPLGESST